MKKFILRFKKNKKLIEYSILILLFLLIFIPRLLIITASPNVATGDEGTYIFLADSLMHERNQTFFDAPTSLPFFYSLTIALFRTIFNVDIVLLARIISAIFGSLSAIILYFISVRLTKSKLVGVVSSLLYSFCWPVFFCTTKIYTEGLFMFLAMLGLYFLLKEKSRSINYILLGFLFLFLSSLTRYEGLIFIFIGFFGIISFHKIKLKSREFRILVLILLLALSLFGLTRLLLGLFSVSSLKLQNLGNQATITKKIIFDTSNLNLFHEEVASFYRKAIKDILTPTILYLSLLGVILSLFFKKTRSFLIIFIWIVFLMVFRMYMIPNMGERYLIEVIPAFTFFASYSIFGIYLFIKKKTKKILSILIIFLLYFAFLLPVFGQYKTKIIDAEKYNNERSWKIPIIKMAEYMKEQNISKILTEPTDIATIWMYSGINYRNIFIGLTSRIYKEKEWFIKKPYLKKVGIEIDTIEDVIKFIEEKDIKYLYLDNIYGNDIALFRINILFPKTLKLIKSYRTGGYRSELYKINLTELKKLNNTGYKGYQLFEPETSNLYFDVIQSSGGSKPYVHYKDIFFTGYVKNKEEWITYKFNLSEGKYQAFVTLYIPSSFVLNGEIFINNNSIKKFDIEKGEKGTEREIEFNFTQLKNESTEIKILAYPSMKSYRIWINNFWLFEKKY